MGRRKALNEILPLLSPSPSSPTPPPWLPPALHPSSPKRSLLSPVPGGDLRQIQSEVRRRCCRVRVCLLCHSSPGRWRVSPPFECRTEEICIGVIYRVFPWIKNRITGFFLVSISQAQNPIILLVLIKLTSSLFSSLCFCVTLREEDKNIFDYCRENNIDHISQAISSQKVDVNTKDEEVFAGPISPKNCCKTVLIVNVIITMTTCKFCRWCLQCHQVMV